VHRCTSDSISDTEASTDTDTRTDSNATTETDAITEINAVTAASTDATTDTRAIDMHVPLASQHGRERGQHCHRGRRGAHHHEPVVERLADEVGEELASGDCMRVRRWQ
jgi:hypothetical protein